jgi:hypothetical protein
VVFSTLKNKKIEIKSGSQTQKGAVKGDFSPKTGRKITENRENKKNHR